ncbi:MAG: PAS domain S-box protein [Spirochaetia bacterium]|nr:PAS domain S-box protein [Spirochaetia bacterium]
MPTLSVTTPFAESARESPSASSRSRVGEGYAPSFPSEAADAAFRSADHVGDAGDSESRYRALVECHPLAVTEASLDGVMLAWNAAAERLFGWTRDEALGRYAPYVPEDLHREYDSMRARVIGGECFVNREIVRRRKDGVFIRLLLSTSPVRDSRGRVRSIVGVFSEAPSPDPDRGRGGIREGSDRRIPKAGGGTSARLVEALFGAEKQLVLHLDPAGCIREAGEFARRVLGRASIEQLRGQAWTEALVHPDDSARADEFLASVAVLGAAETRLAFRTGHGARIVLELYARRVESGDEGRSFLVVGSIAADHARFLPGTEAGQPAAGRILANLEDAVIALDSDCSTILEGNRAASLTFGLPGEDLVGKSLDLFCAQEERIAVWASGELARKGFAQGDVRLKRSNGVPFPARAQVVPVLDENGASIRTIAVFKDLSHERQIEADRGYLIGRLKSLASSIAELGSRLGAEEAPHRLSEWGVTHRQEQVAKCLASGMSNKEIARAMEISESAVKVQVFSLYRKTRTHSRVEFIRFIREMGIEP